MTHNAAYIGRYAPSPTGGLHLGNLQTALLAWLHARLNGGQFLVRIEDIDKPRVVPGSDRQILRDLEWLGIDWDGDVAYQSQRTELYKNALDKLAESDLLYPCYCSRKDIREAASAPHLQTTKPSANSSDESHNYPQTCRGLTAQEQARAAKKKPPALRLKTFVGDLTQDDFVVKRADGLFAYQLVVTVDDLAQGITHVVRGADLAESKLNQLQLAKHLAPQRAPIIYQHTPLLMDASGQRMSKRGGSESTSQLHSQGLKPAQVVAGMVTKLGLVAPSTGQITAQELLQSVSLPQLDALLS